MLLCGYPPFTGRDIQEIFNRISKGVFHLVGKEWSCVSQEAKNLLMKMLTLDPSARPTAKEVFLDSWVQNSGNSQVQNNLIASKSLKNLYRFRSAMFFQQVTLEYIASHLTTAEEVSELRKAFIAIDEDGDGKLSLQELESAYQNASIHIDSIHKILDVCDVDGNGLIDYTEFITATINWRKSLNDEKLEGAFEAFDKNGDGTISIDELELFLGDAVSNECGILNEIFFEADTNGDGVIDLEEFKTLMLKRHH